MEKELASTRAFHAEVTNRFGILPNFFRSANAAQELIEQLWGFAKAGYLDNPMPSVFKERLFVWLSRFCPMRYCIVRHVGFLLGHGYGHAAGDATAHPQSIEEIVRLLRQPTPWQRDMAPVYEFLEGQTNSDQDWPDSGSELEDAIFACAAVMFIEPARSERARGAVKHAVNARRFEFFSGCLAFIRTAHYWTMLHPEIETEEDMRSLLSGHEVLARLLLEDSESDRCEMGERVFEELTTLRELHERQELKEAKRALEEKDQQKDQFIAVLAHELRNPLATIRLATDAMNLLGLKDQSAVRLLERLDRQTTAMSRMLDDLLDASRIALGKVSVNLEGVDVTELLANALDERQLHAQEAGLHLVANLKSEPVIAKADRVRLRQIVDNLLANAIKFTPAGGHIELSFAREKAYGVITVRDSGIGFDPGLAQKLFEPFTQLEQDRNRKPGGLGLGLAIASRLATLQQGSLVAASEGPNRGALFTLKIPIAEGLEKGSAATPHSPQLARTKVLVVDDNRDVADSLADFLDLMGYDSRIAHDGATAIKMALDTKPDLIICDLGLPEPMDGFAFARACRAENALKAVRLIAASGYSSQLDHTKAKDAGFESLFAKPLTHESLTSIMRE